MSGYLGKTRQTPQEINLVFSGFGPRNAILLKAIAATLLAQKKRKLDKVQVVGKYHKLRLTFIEAQLANKDGVPPSGGNAFQHDCHAALNNTISGLTPIANLDEVPAHLAGPLAAVLDLKTRVAKALEEDLESHIAELEAVNLACAGLFKNAIRPDKTLNADIAFTTRGTIGDYQDITVAEMLDIIKDELPDLAVEFMDGWTVVDTDLSNRTRPAVIAKNLSAPDTTKKVTGHLVFLANGTTWEVPVKGEAAAASLSGVPNHGAVGEYLKERNGLHPYNPITGALLKTDFKIGVTGLGLSAFDMATLAMRYMPAFKPSKTDPRGWALDADAAKLYAGMFTFISRSETIPMPRLVYAPNWFGDQPAFSTRMMHAMGVQRDFDWLSVAKRLLFCSTARTLGKRPQDVNPAMPVAEKFAYYHEQTKAYYANPAPEARGRLELGLLRSGFQAIANGMGLERDPAAAEAELASIAPFSRKGTAGWPLQRALLYNQTRPHTARLSSNAEFVKNWNELQLYLTASPPEIHDMIAQAFMTGMARHISASYSDIDEQLVGGRINVKGEKLDALLASRILTTRADPVFQSLKGKVTETVPGQPDYAKARALTTLDGDELHVFDNGSGGYGRFVQDASGQSSLVGAQWHDTNAHISANDQAPTIALTAITAASLIANGDRFPLRTMGKIYNGELPRQSEFAAETARFSADFTEVLQRDAFCDLCDRVAATGEKYREYTDAMFTPQSRSAMVDKLRAHHMTAVKGYEQRIASLPKYDPLSIAEFEKQFVDYRADQAKFIFDEACDMIVKGL